MSSDYVPLAGDAPAANASEDPMKRSFLMESTEEEEKVIDFKKLLKQHR